MSEVKLIRNFIHQVKELRATVEEHLSPYNIDPGEGFYSQGCCPMCKVLSQKQVLVHDSSCHWDKRGYLHKEGAVNGVMAGEHSIYDLHEWKAILKKEY